MIASPKLPVTIRAFSALDFQHWLELWKKYQIFYKTDIPENVSRMSFSRMLDSEEPTFGAFATSGERLLGFAHWIFHRTNWTTGDYCYLQDLYVDEEFRGVGVGSSLITHVNAEAKKAGASEVYWLTHETNTKAMLLYDKVAERSGFLQYRQTL